MSIYLAKDVASTNRAPSDSAFEILDNVEYLE
jgi:hypothetical protein